MSKIKNGGSAFPRGEIQSAPGMTLRDYFAAKALQGMLADGKGWEQEEIVETAYRVADAMLRAREAAP